MMQASMSLYPAGYSDLQILCRLITTTTTITSIPIATIAKLIQDETLRSLVFRSERSAGQRIPPRIRSNPPASKRKKEI